MIKKILFAAGIVLALILIVVIILSFVIDINTIVAAQIPKIESQIHRKVAIGDVKLTILSGLGAEIRDVNISNHPDFRKEDFIRFDSVKATVQLLPLLKKEVLVSSVSIEKPYILIEKDARGHMNFSDIVAAKAPPKETEKKRQTEPDTKNALAALEHIQLSKISIKDGNFKYLDASDARASKEISLDNFNLVLKAVSLSQKIHIDLTTDVYASPKVGHVALSGDLGPVGTEMVPEKIPVDLTLILDDINLSHLASHIKGMQIKSGSIKAKTALKGRLQDSLQCHVDLNWDKLDMTTGDAGTKDSPVQSVSINGPWVITADISGSNESQNATGKITFDNSAIRYGKLFDKPADIPLDIDFDVAVKADSQEFKKVLARIGSLEATVSGRVDKGPVIDVKVQTNRFSVNKLVSLSPQVRLPKDLQLPDDVQISASAAGTAEDLGFKAKVEATEGKIVFGHVFQKEPGTPLFADVFGRLKKDSLRITGLKVVLSKMALEANVDIRNFADPFINGKAAIAPTPLDALAPILPALKAYDLQGTIELSDARFKGKIDDLKNLKGVTGSLTVKGGSATSAELAKTINKIQATITVADNAVQIKNTSLHIDQSDLTINATARNPMKPDITFHLASSYLDVDTLLPPPSAEKKKPEAPKESPAESTPKTGTPTKKKALDLQATGKASIKTCKYNTLIFDNVLAELQYADAVATIKNLSFDTFGGNITTSAKVNIADMESPQWSANLTTHNVNANATLSQFTSIKDTIYGNFNSRISLEGKGSEWSTISKTIAGSGSTDILNGKLAKVNVLDAVGQSLLKFQGLSLLAQAIAPGTQKHLNETNFNDLFGKFNIQDGKILLDAITMSSKDFTLSGAGNIGLDKSLDLDTVLVLSKSASERLQKDNIMKYLLNKDQLLEIPCTVKGDITAFRIIVDGDSLNRLMQNAAQDQIQKGVQKGVEDKLGKEVDKLLKGIIFK